MIIAFKNKLASPQSRYSQLVAWWTRSEWIHCEIILETYNYQMVSARLDGVGVSFQPMTTILTDPDQWEYYRVPVSVETPAYDFLKLQVKSPYNYWGIAQDLVLGWDGQQPGDWFCSELTYYVLQRYSILDVPNVDPSRVAPAQLRALLRAMHCDQLAYQHP